MSCELFVNDLNMVVTLHFQFEDKVEFFCPYFNADSVPPYPSKNIKAYTECCVEKCCTKEGKQKELKEQKEKEEAAPWWKFWVK